MFGIGMPELMIIFAIALIVIGPAKLPELARSLGKTLNEFKRATDDFKWKIEEDSRAHEEKERIAKEAAAREEQLKAEAARLAAIVTTDPAATETVHPSLTPSEPVATGTAAPPVELSLDDKLRLAGITPLQVEQPASPAMSPPVEMCATPAQQVEKSAV